MQLVLRGGGNQYLLFLKRFLSLHVCQQFSCVGFWAWLTWAAGSRSQGWRDVPSAALESSLRLRETSYKLAEETQTQLNAPRKIKYKEGEKRFPIEKVPSEHFHKSPDFNKPAGNQPNRTQSKSSPCPTLLLTPVSTLCSATWLPPCLPKILRKRRRPHVPPCSLQHTEPIASFPRPSTCPGLTTRLVPTGRSCAEQLFAWLHDPWRDAEVDEDDGAISQE